MGDIVYEAELSGVAVLTLATGDGGVMNFYVPGLAGNVDSRGQFEGYWVSSVGGSCPAMMTGPNSVESNNWGRAVFTFHEPAFPSGFTVFYGSCFADPDVSLVAQPVVGGE
ncbi:MAG: hypothetical protein JWR75_422 [Devosia sp.]|nr:hypothetical protein [Devosia sp.]